MVHVLVFATMMLTAPVALALASSDCDAYLQKSKKLRGEVQDVIRKAFGQGLDVRGPSCKLRGEEWSIRDEKHQAWCAGKDAAAIDQRLSKMSADLKACGGDLEEKRLAALGTGGTTSEPPAVVTPSLPLVGITPSLPRSSSCFDARPGFDRKEAEDPSAERMRLVMADAIVRIFGCAKLSDAFLLDVFAAVSVHIARHRPAVACFDGDWAVLLEHFEPHRNWAAQRDRGAVRDGTLWKVDRALGCDAVEPALKKAIYGAVMMTLDQADHGALKGMENLSR